VLARGNGGDRPRTVQSIRCWVVHDIDVRVGEESLVTVMHCRDAVLGRILDRAVVAARRNGHDLDLVV
jgi:hypothetical protein